MAKGFYTQGVCVLLERPVTLDEVAAALADFSILKRVDLEQSWEVGGPTLIVDYRRKDNGLVAVDVVARPWPDHMGDPQREPNLFGAWAMGHFGPHAYPHNLARAAEQSWAWEAGREMPAKHQAFLRIRSSYIFGADEDAKVVPENYEPLPELEFVTKLAAALLDVPGALCYFNPGGEVLRDRDTLRETLNYNWQHQLPSLDVWSNVRLFNINDDWSLMDTVGNEQLDLPDIEACFASESYDMNEVDNFLRNASLYLVTEGEVIAPGDTMDGPGGLRWQAHPFENGLTDPPRRVLRFLPLDDREVPPELLATEEDEEE